ncbi:MAG: cystathionine gamma-lyase, partial [Ignavibacteria bacterium]|nr:cystathionine gamma-lyase [Ignavibacteria bacterium]
VLQNSITEKTKVIYFETPANPNIQIIDIKAVRDVVDQFNKVRNEQDQIYIVIDNTFATPFCQRPIEYGADFVVHSLTKGIGGFGTDMGGAVIGKKKFQGMIQLIRKDFGAALSPKNAWSILTYGLPTLAVRQRQQIKTASRVAEYLNAHPKVEFVNYPGLPNFKYYELAKKQMIDFNGNFAPGSMIYFTLKGSNPFETREIGKKFMDHVADKAYTMTLAVSLGHTRTLIEHPASMTHSVVPPEELDARGIDPGGIRLAIGLENPDDILFDLDESLKII